MARIFLDIGAHTGETLQVVQEQRWGFDRIHSFEPAPACWPALVEAAGPLVEVHEFGLWDRDAVVPLFNAGSIGASVSGDKERVGERVSCEFRDAANWFDQNITEHDVVFAKVNVEGAEAELIRRLDEAGVLGLIDHLLIHFDVRKVPSKEHLEGELRDRLERAGVEFFSADEIQFGGVYRGTRNWLRWCQSTSSVRDLRYRRLAQLEHVVRVRLYPLKEAVLKQRSALGRRGIGRA